ncbi:hypothetical protein [Rummeliibacillus suwonensis]|uniref:hypothetical protein n=1 Tax=Rummeliibacillus suwonensis TaxID=1306154 RepID=UPI001FD19A6E|nr:hypothetical protein [Rummeliibacillus suwonensis]
MYMQSDHKIIYCYNCKTHTIYHHRDTHGNSYVESHCSECGWFEWQNKAVEREKQKWIAYNIEQSIEIPILKSNIRLKDSKAKF